MATNTLPELEINREQTGEENILRLINSIAIEALTTADITIGQPTVETTANPYYNTGILLTATETSRFTGSDKLYYHRVVVSEKGAQGRESMKHIARPIYTSDTGDALLNTVCNVLELRASEFTLEARRSGKITHVLSAKPNSYLYVGELGVVIAASTTSNGGVATRR